MTFLQLSANPQVRTWQTQADNLRVTSNLPGITLKGDKAAAYLFGQALVSMNPNLFGVNNSQLVTREQASIEFPPGSSNLVSINELADAMRYKYNLDPLIEYSQGMGLQGYSRVDINAIIAKLNTEYAGWFSLTPLPDDRPAGTGPGAAGLPTVAPPILKTELELRAELSSGNAQVYIDRHGAFFINGVRTRPMDLAVVSRYLVQDQLSTQYKTLMDEMATRNNQIAAARSIIDAIDNPTGGSEAEIQSALHARISSLQTQLGSSDLLSEMTAGQFTAGTVLDANARAALKSQLNTLISNKLGDGDVAQSKLQSITSELQNNVEAMSAMIKLFIESSKAIAQSLG